MLRPILKYADFTGRAARSEYWMFVLFQGLVFLALGVCFIAVLTSGHDNLGRSLIGMVGLGLVAIVFSLGCFLPNLAVSVRRLHDSNRSGWWLCLCLPGWFVSIGDTHSAIEMLKGLGSGDASLAALTAFQSQTSPLSMLGPICNLLLFALTVMPGTKGPNRFGDDPTGLGPDVRVFDDAPAAPEPDTAQAAQPFDYGSFAPVVAPPPPKPVPPPYAPRQKAAPTFGKRK